jgi:hypothetical protein
VAKDTPSRDRSLRERGTYARHADRPTIASYLSSLLFLLAVPAAVGLAYGGFWLGWYGYSIVVPAFAAVMLGVIALAFAAMGVFG